MKFRDRKIENIQVIEEYHYFDLITEIKILGEQYNIIDLQYSTRVDWIQNLYGGYPATDSNGNPVYYPQTVYSVILLLAKKEKILCHI